MLTYLVAFALAFAVAAALTPVLRALAPLIGGVDQAQSSRKVHTRPIPRIGGVAIVAAFFVPLVGLLLYRTDVGALFVRDTSRVVGLFVGGLAIALLGFYDDLHGLGARHKFAVQFAVAGLMYALGYRIEAISHPFGGAIALGLLSLPFTLVWIVGIINAMNLIDGLDGLAGGVAIIAVGLTFAVSFHRPDVLMCLFMAALGGALLGFLLYNFNPATIFMGDTGSMFLGFVLATTSVASSQKSSATVAMLVPIVGLGLPIADTLLAMLRRALRGRPLFSADREHIHHKLLALGLTHRQAVLVLYGVCLSFAGAAFGLTYANSRQAAILLSVLGAVAIVLLRALGYLAIDRESRGRNASARGRNQRVRAVVRDVGDRLRDAGGLDLVWESVKLLGAALDAREMTLSLIVREEAGEEVRNVLRWRAAEAPATHAACTVLLDIESGAGGAKVKLGEVEVRWTDGRREVERDDEIALETMVDHLETALGRLRGLEVAGASNVIELRRRAEREHGR